MYYCHSCNCEFDTPEIIIETHGLSSPPYEKFSICPFCRSTNFSLIKVRYCHACGARLYGENENYCNDSCRLTAKRLEEKERKRQKVLRESPLTVLIREVEEYNKNNNTNFSYGQYVTLIKPKLTREENAKEETIS